jgi:hypothetical protein
LRQNGQVSAPVRIGRYRVDRRIGSGSFATVWLAHDEVLDAPVAVKVLAEALLHWAIGVDLDRRSSGAYYVQPLRGAVDASRTPLAEPLDRLAARVTEDSPVKITADRSMHQCPLR